MLVTNGAMHGLYVAFRALLDPGDEAIMPDPTWTETADNVMLAGGRVVRVPLNPAARLSLRRRCHRDRHHAEDAHHRHQLASQSDRARGRRARAHGDCPGGGETRPVDCERRGVRARAVRRSHPRQRSLARLRQGAQHLLDVQELRDERASAGLPRVQRRPDPRADDEAAALHDQRGELRDAVRRGCRARAGRRMRPGRWPPSTRSGATRSGKA